MVQTMLIDLLDAKISLENANSIFHTWTLLVGIVVSTVVHARLTLILPSPKEISICQKYRARPACTSVPADRAADQALNCWLTNSSFHLDIPKMITDRFRNILWSILFKKFDMVRVKASKLNPYHSLRFDP